MTRSYLTDGVPGARNVRCITGTLMTLTNRTSVGGIKGSPHPSRAQKSRGRDGPDSMERAVG